MKQISSVFNYLLPVDKEATIGFVVEFVLPAGIGVSIGSRVDLALPIDTEASVGVGVEAGGISIDVSPFTMSIPRSISLKDPEEGPQTKKIIRPMATVRINAARLEGRSILKLI